VASIIEIALPDLGTRDPVDVIEISVKPGDVIKAGDTLLTLEGDKASMEVPATQSGTVQNITIKVGDKVQTGTVFLTLEVEQAPAAAVAPKEMPKPVVNTEVTPVVSKSAPVAANVQEDASVYASPSVRRLARALDIHLSGIAGTGDRGRICTDDIHAHIKQRMQNSSGSGLPKAPIVDFTQFGDITVEPLNKIKKLTGSYLSRNWLLAPHVTQFDEADITALEHFRKEQATEAQKQGVKLTPLFFIMKAVAATLKAFPRFNASLDETQENLILKQYVHIGVAVDTPNGLVVPVIRDVDKLSIVEIAGAVSAISKKAREKGLAPADMQGGCFTISSLGGIGGTAFTPIINLPEVAILGVSKAAIKPVYVNDAWVPRLFLPLSLSYDHRVIDGAEGARFLVHLSSLLSDIRRLLI